MNSKSENKLLDAFHEKVKVEFKTFCTVVSFQRIISVKSESKQISFHIFASVSLISLFSGTEI